MIPLTFARAGDTIAAWELCPGDVVEVDGTYYVARGQYAHDGHDVAIVVDPFGEGAPVLVAAAYALPVRARAAVRLSSFARPEAPDLGEPYRLLGFQGDPR